MAHASDRDMIAKTRNTARFFTENTHISWTLLVFTVLWGIYGYLSMPKRKDPEIPVRVAAVLLSWPGATAENVEQRVTRAVERKLAENSKVERIESTTRAGVSVVTVMLDESVKETGKEFDDIWLKLQGIGGLPEGASIEFLKDFGDTSALMLTVASPRASEAEVALRAADIERKLRATRGDLTDASDRAALVACFPHALDARDFLTIGQEFGEWLAARGAEDVRPLSGAGFLAIDSRTHFSDEQLLAAAYGFSAERLRGAERHPDAWRFSVIRDPAQTAQKLAAVAGEKYSYRELDIYSEQLEKALQAVPAVARVSRSGVVGDVVYLDYSQERLASYGIGPSQVRQAIDARNITARGGAVEVQGKNVLIAPEGELLSERELGEIVVGKSKSDAPVYLRDVASINRAYETPRYVSYSTWRDAQGNWQRTRAIVLSITMKSGLQIADFGRAVEAKIAQTRKLLPEDLLIDRVSDQPQQVQENVDLFMSSLYEAIVLVVIVALVGFWEWRSAVLMALSIPITLAMTFGFMRLLGIDVQQISIGSLIIALGLLVDDPVVAGDAIKRDMAKGLPARIAAWLGPTKLATAILFATGTNIMAYLPFLIVDGDNGRFIYSLPIVLTASLVASRLVSMTFIPLLGMTLLRPSKRPEPPIEERRQRGFARVYSRLVAGAVHHRWWVLGASTALFALGVFSVRDLKQSFFPKDYSYLSYVDVWLPEDSPISTTHETAQEVEQIVREVAQPLGLHSVTTFVGGGGPRFWFSISPEQRQSNYAQLIIRMQDKHQTEHLVGPLQRELSRRIAGARVDVRQIESGGGVGIPIAIRIAGESPAVLRELAAKLEDLLRRQPNTERIRDNWGSDNFSVKLKVDPARASAADVTNKDVVNSSTLALNGARVGTLQEGDHQLPIVMRLRASEREQLSDVENLYVYSSQDPRTKIPLRQISELGFSGELGKIARRNHVRTITVSAFPRPGALSSEVIAQIMPELARIERELPPGYALEIGGEHHEASKSFEKLQLVLVMSVLAIFAMLVWQFRNAVKPVIVFAAIPFGVIAALVSLLVMQTPFGFMAFLGLISLIGVIVSHVIVLFDFIEERHEAGAPLLEALTDAGILRLRPVLVTVGATVLGLVPLAMHGGPLWEPLCWVQIGGLSFATVVTLLIVPVLYAIFVLDLKLVKWGEGEYSALRERPSRASLAPLGAAGALLLLALAPGLARAEAGEAPAASLTGKVGGLVSGEMARRATATSLVAEQRLHEVEAARAQLDKALLDYLPRLSATGSFTQYESVPAASLGTFVVAPGASAGPIGGDQALVAAPVKVKLLDQYSSVVGAVSVPFTDYAFRLVQAHQAAKAQLGAAEHTLEAARRKADYDARALYYDWVKAELDAEVARQDLALGNENLTRVRALAEADSASLADVARAEASVASSELVRVRAENVAALQRERCRIAMHDDSQGAYEIGEDFRSLPPVDGNFDDIPGLVRVAQQQRPELAALAAQVRAQERLSKVARAQAFPRIDLSAQSVTANPNSRYFPPQDEFKTTWQVGAQLTLSPNDMLTGRKQAQTYRARAQQADAERRGMLDAVRSEVVEAVLSHRNAVAAIDTSARRLRAAETSYTARRERYLAEKATLVELTEAQTELLRARLDAVQAQVSIRVARARLAYVTGSAS